MTTDAKSRARRERYEASGARKTRVAAIRIDAAIRAELDALSAEYDVSLGALVGLAVTAMLRGGQLRVMLDMARKLGAALSDDD